MTNPIVATFLRKRSDRKDFLYTERLKDEERYYEEFGVLPFERTGKVLKKMRLKERFKALVGARLGNNPKAQPFEDCACFYRD